MDGVHTRTSSGPYPVTSPLTPYHVAPQTTNSSWSEAASMAGLGMSVVGSLRAIELLRDVRDAYGKEVVWIVGVGAEYGAYLEFGTSRMPAYPFLFPAARHVMATKFRTIEARARATTDPTENLVIGLAKAIETQAKRNVGAGGTRSPGVHPEHPKVVSGNLRDSIEAFPASAGGF